MRIISLFDGMSVARQALEDIGADVETYYASEIDPYAIAVAQSNWPETKQMGSVTDFGWRLADIDLLIGGSPCQDLSIAKKGREGLKGSRSGLFYEYLRIRDEVKPKYFVLENVASMSKEAKDTISEALGVEPVMINASLVSAQNRKRLFWVGKWNGEKYVQVDIEQPEDRGILLKDILENDVDEKYFIIGDWKVKRNPEHNNTSGAAVRKQVNDERGIEIRKDEKSNALNTIENHKLVRIGSLNSGGQGDRISSQEGKSVALSANGGGRGAKTGLYAVPVALRNRGEGKKPEYNGTNKANAMTSVQTDSMVAVFSNYNNTLNYDKANTLGSNSQCQTAKTGQGLVDFEKQIIRKLTPTECLRLQSMPDTYFDKAIYKNKPISNTQRYKMCGNAFNKEVIVHILKHLFHE